MFRDGTELVNALAGKKCESTMPYLVRVKEKE